MRICEAFEYEFLTSTLNSFIFGTSSTGKVGQTWLARSSFALDDSNKAFASSIKRPVSANLVLYLAQLMAWKNQNCDKSISWIWAKTS